MNPIITPLRNYETWPFWQGIELFGAVPLTLYGLAYALGLALGLQYAVRLARSYPSSITHTVVSDFFIYAVIGVILGGRIGFAVFYPEGLNVSAWYQIFNPFYGGSFGLSGMSFHGGMIGVGVALIGFWLINKRRFHPLALMDIIAAAAPIGIYFGRLANFFNRELYGRIAPDWWPFKLVFGTDEERYACRSYWTDMCDLSQPRHPSQLYEALLEGAVLFFVLGILVRHDWVRQRVGFITGAFLAGYGLFRFVIEYARQPDIHVFNAAEWLTRGQQLSIPMLLLGLVVMMLAQGKRFGQHS